METYSEWRDNEVKRVGLDVQLKAEALIERDQAQKRVLINDDRSQSQLVVKESIAESRIKKGRASRSRSYFDFGAKGKR